MEPDRLECERCQEENHWEYFPDSATAHKIYDQGEVVRIKESVDILVQRGIIENTATLLNYEGFTFREYAGDSDGDCRIRPALLLKPRKVTTATDSSIPSTLVLFATFEGYAPLRDDLPKVLQRFSIPIAPHSAIEVMTEDNHVHTIPEWSNSRRKQYGPVDAWLIAREYTSVGDVDRRWGNVNGTERGSTFEVDWDTWEDILESMDELWTGWLEECRESRGVLEDYQREYLECLATMKKRQAAIQRRQTEKANLNKATKGKEVQDAALAGTSKTQQPPPVAISSSSQASPPHEMKQATQVTQNRSFASVLAAGSKQKSTRAVHPASTTAQIVKPDRLPAIQQASAVRPSTAERLKALFAPKKDPVTDPSQSTNTPDQASSHAGSQHSSEQIVDESANAAEGSKKGTKGKRIAVPA